MLENSDIDGMIGECRDEVVPLGNGCSGGIGTVVGTS